LVAPEQIIQKDGYLYIYVSNESAQKLFFDNLVIHHNKGHLLEEDQYYPFGLKMAGISDQALPVVLNNYLYNGKELQQNEFSDGSGLEDYDYGFRGYDPQIARFTEQDPLTDEFATLTPYQYASNDPVANIDLDGLEGVGSVGGLAGTSARIAMYGNLSEVLITAAKPITTSSVLFMGLDAIGRIGNYVSITTHGVQIMDHIFYGIGVTQAVGSQINSNEMNAIFPKANQNIVNGFISNFNKYSGDFGITDDETMAQFLAQAGTETEGFTKLSEKMNYSNTKKGIRNLKINFPRLFVTGPYKAEDYVENGDALAKIAYGTNKSGLDYRGRGVMQLTKEYNYNKLTEFYDQIFNSTKNFVKHPNL
ncbi:MAG: RHS repeat-associated core domain-containing protein, partial [Chitinophagaceae bacterium]